MAKSLSPFTPFLVRAKNYKLFTHSDFKMMLSFAIMDSIATIALKFMNNARM